MAKKGQALQLQAELNTEEEWEKFLQRDGLLVIDVYSEWCGPCAGMSANLKKVKLEIGGDLLHLAMAKADNIEKLKRFRNKSEPTWLFVVDGKMVNLMFGANAPKLVRLVTAELNNEKLRREGQFERTEILSISEMAEEEQDRHEAAQSIIRAELEVEEKKRKEELHERRCQECINILENLNNLGVILIFPHAKDKYNEAILSLLTDANLVIGFTNKFLMTEEILEELMYFVEDERFEFSDDTVAEILEPGKETIALLLKQGRAAAELEAPIEDYVLEIVYGHMMKPPGSPESAADQLHVVIEPEEGSDEHILDLAGIWCPPDERVRAVCLKLFFRKMAKHYLIPEPEPTPEHLAVMFEALRRTEIFQIMQKYPNEIMRYGFFTSQVPEEAEVIAKSMKKYEHAPNRTFKEKLIIQLSKKKSECLLEFAQAKPLYMSPNAKEGKRECRLLFPDGFDEPPAEDEEEIDESAMTVPPDILQYLEGDQAGLEEEDEESEESEEEEDDDEDEEEEEDEAVDEYGSLFGSII